MTIRYYADVLDGGEIHRICSVDDPDEGPPNQPDAEGMPQYLGTSFAWNAPTSTSRPTWPAGATAIVWVDDTALAVAIAAARDAIDAAAETVRQAAVAKRTLKADEYAQAETQARAWRASAYVGDAPVDVQAWADARYRDNMTARQAADDIIAQGDAYRSLLSGVRAARLKEMENARYATTPQEAAAIADRATTTFGALK